MALTAALLVAPTFAQESGEAQNLSWVTPAEGSDWSAGLPDFNPGDNVTFGTNATNESVTLDQDVQAGALTIEGDYTLNGNGTLTADAITVAEGGTLTLGKKTITSARYVRLHITKRTASGNYADGIAVAEVALFKGGEQLSWDGATATVTNYSTHPAANLINGNLNDKWMWTAGTTFSVDLTFDAGAGKTFEFDGYNLASADQNGRNPTAWELQVSNDGSSYTTVDSRTYEDAVATAWATKSWIFEEPLGVTNPNIDFPVAESITVNGAWVIDASSAYTLPAISGTGTVVKTGTGTLSLNSGTVVEPTLHIQAGTFSLPSTSSSGYGTVYTDVPNVIVEGGATLSVPQWATNVKDAEATFTLRNNAIFSFANGNSYDNRDIAPKFLIENDGTSPTSFRGSSNGDNTKLTGGISGKGLILFEQGGSNGYTVSGVIADGADGTLAVRVNDTNSTITFSGANTYTGGTEIMTSLTVSNADALGRGAVSIAEGGTLTVNGSTTLNVYGAIKSAGTIAGAIALQEGASIDASAGAVAFDTLSVAEGVTIPVTLPAEAAIGTELVTWTTGPADAAAFSAELAAGLALAVEGTTLKVVEGAPAGDLTWVTGSADWTTGLPGYAAGANVTFGANTETGAENVVVPADTPAAGAVTISGDYAFGAENFGADSLEVTADGSLTLLGQPISARYVTFMALSAGNISEFTLYRDGEPVNLEGMAVSGVESAANAVDGSTETDVSFGQAMAFIQIDAGEGKTISFDSYNVATGADASKFPGGWYLLAGSTQTPNLQADMKELMGMDGVEAPAAGAYLWETPRALSGSTGSKLSIEGTATIAGTLGGNGTVTAKTIDFAEGAAIKPTGVGYLTLSAEEITGATELVLDTSALNLPAEADPTTNVYVLITSVKTDFTFTGVPEGYRVRNLGGNGYVLTKDFKQPFSATVSGTVNWEDLVWTDANNVEIPSIIRDYLRGDMANLSLVLTATTEGARVYVDTAAPASLTINESEHQLTLAVPEGTAVAFEPAALTVNGDLYVGDGALTLPAETTLNATLTYATFSRAVVSGKVTGTGNGSIVKTGTGALAIAEGANVGVNIEVQAGALAPAADTTLVSLTLADGTTLDLSAGLPLAIKGTLTVPGVVDETDAPTITVNLAADFVATEEPQTLVTYAALASGRLEPADIVFTGVTAENWLVDFGEKAITVEAQATIPLPEGVVGDETGGFSEDAQAAILGAVAGTEGVTSVASVTLTLNGQSADTATFNDLAACVANLPLSVTVGENGVATVTAACNLTITSIEIADGKVVVAATLTGADGEATPLTLKSGVKVELVPVTLDGTEPGDVLGTAEVGADGALTLPSPEATAGTVLFKVRLTPPSAE